MNSSESVSDGAVQRPSFSDFRKVMDAPAAWDVYETSLAHVTVLEGSWKFNQRLRISVNGTTTKNGLPLTEPVILEGIIRATRSLDTFESIFLKADGDDRSADVHIAFGERASDKNGN